MNQRGSGRDLKTRVNQQFKRVVVIDVALFNFDSAQLDNFVALCRVQPRRFGIKHHEVKVVQTLVLEMGGLPN